MTNLSIDSDDFTIRCRDLIVAYQVNEYRSSTLKETLISKFRRRPPAEPFQALKGVTLEVSKGECLALIGHNGSGKSTMLKAIAGIMAPTGGSVETHGTCVPLIELGAGFDPELTGRENIFLCLGLLGLTREQVGTLVPSILEFSELTAHIDMPVKTYSSGMYMRLGFACSVCVHADILLIDEILSVGDENFQRKCITRMREIRKNGSTMLLVSHDLGQIQELADRVAVFDQGKIIFDGHPKEAIDFYHKLMDRKRLAALPGDLREEELRQRALQEHAETQQFGVAGKLKRGELHAQHPGLLQSGEKCVLSIDFELLKNFDENVCVGFAIHTTANVRLFGGNTQLLKIGETKQMTRAGSYRVDFQFDRLILAAGKYRLITALHNSSLTETLDINGCAQEFEVEDVLKTRNFDGDILDTAVLIRNGTVHPVELL